MQFAFVMHMRGWGVFWVPLTWVSRSPHSEAVVRRLWGCYLGRSRCSYHSHARFSPVLRYREEGFAVVQVQWRPSIQRDPSLRRTISRCALLPGFAVFFLCLHAPYAATAAAAAECVTDGGREAGRQGASERVCVHVPIHPNSAQPVCCPQALCLKSLRNCSRFSAVPRSLGPANLKGCSVNCCAAPSQHLIWEGRKTFGGGFAIKAK